MHKMWTVARREFLSRLKTKGFIIGTVLAPVFLIGMTVLPEFFMFLKSDQPKQFAVIDQTGAIFDSLVVALDDRNATGQRVYNLTEHQASAATLPDLEKTLTAQINNGELDGYFVIPADILTAGKAEYRAKSVTNFVENNRLENALSRTVRAWRIEQSGLNAEQVRLLVRRVGLRPIRILASGQEEEDQGRTEGLVRIMVMFIYAAMLVYGQIVMRSVIEEKSSRVIESIIASLKPFQLMTGKILGVGALGLTQYSLWAATMGLLSLYGVQVTHLFTRGAPSNANLALPSVPPEVLLFFVLFFILGYFLYAAIFAGLGAMVNSDQEAQQLVFPVVMLVVIPFLCTFYIIENPNTQLSVILSLIPFFAPMTMFARIVVQMPPVWEIALCLVLLVTTIAGMIWLVGRIFRVGVLMYGKRPTLPEVVKWIKYA